MSDNTVKLLLVEDDDEAVERALRKAKIANPIHRAKDGIEAFDMLRGTNGHEQLQRP